MGVFSDHGLNTLLTSSPYALFWQYFWRKISFVKFRRCQERMERIHPMIVLIPMRSFRSFSMEKLKKTPDREPPRPQSVDPSRWVFLQAPPARYLCAICEVESMQLTILFDVVTVLQDVFQKPVIIKSCGHHFCEPCLAEWIRSNRTCPVCRAPVSPVLIRCLLFSSSSALSFCQQLGFVKAFFAEEAIDELHVRCPLGVTCKQAGSQSRFGVLGEDYVEIPGENACKAWMRLKDLAAHTKNCGKRKEDTSEKERQLRQQLGELEHQLIERSVSRLHQFLLYSVERARYLGEFYVLHVLLAVQHVLLFSNEHVLLVQVRSATEARVVWSELIISKALLYSSVISLSATTYICIYV